MQETEILKALEKHRLRCYKDLTPQEASKILLKISSLYGTVTEMAVDAEMEYNRTYQRFTEDFEKVTEARAHAKASPEYEKRLRFEGHLDVTKELIRSLKYLLKVKLDERRESVY